MSRLHHLAYKNNKKKNEPYILEVSKPHENIQVSRELKIDRWKRINECKQNKYTDLLSKVQISNF